MKDLPEVFETEAYPRVFGRRTCRRLCLRRHLGAQPLVGRPPRLRGMKESKPESDTAKYDILLAFSEIDAERRLEYREPSGPDLRHARFAGLRMGRVAS